MSKIEKIEVTTEYIDLAIMVDLLKYMQGGINA